MLTWCRALVGVALNVSLGYVEKKAAEDGLRNQDVLRDAALGMMEIRHPFCQQGGSVPGIRAQASGLRSPAKPLLSTCVASRLFSVRLLWRLMQRVFTSLKLGSDMCFLRNSINNKMCIQYIGSDKSSVCTNSA